MQTCILFILGLQLVFCSQLTNITGDESYPVCPFTLFRRKRANGEYTRWRSNPETTPEFIVKVLDEDVSTAAVTNQVVAVNILPVTKRGEKIIVGGAMVLPPSHTTSIDIPREYTRFVPPTTVPGTHIDGEMYLAPVQLPQKANVNVVKPKAFHADEPAYAPVPEGRHALRDESPPVSPQFVARPQPAVARQFAPIAAVAFTRRPTLTPLTPPFLEHNKKFIMPTRTSSETMAPIRTAEFQFFRQFDDDSRTQDFFETRTTLETIPERTTTQSLTSETFVDDLHELIPTTSENPEGRRHEAIPSFIPTLTTLEHHLEKEGDASYNNMFLYHEDYKEGVNKKEDKEFGFTDNDKEKGNEENEFDIGPETSESVVVEVVDPENRNKSEIQIYPDDTEEFDNSTDSKTVYLSDTTTEQMAKEKSDKPKPVCSMLKLRQLNFNSPRTLPEIVAHLKQWAEDSPVAKWVDITDGNSTTMENPIYMMIIDDPSSGQIITAKQTVLVVAGIQGRDHHAVSAAMYLLYQLIERSEAHSDLLTKYRFWIIPVFNPDGYDYSMTFPHRREWTKNLRQNWDMCKTCTSCLTYGLRCTIQPCYGVNLDRNFEYQWIPTEELRAEHPCGSLYAGTRQLSEQETRALTQYLHNQRTPLYTFIAFKEGNVLGVMYPYSHTKKKRAFDLLYRQRASRAAASAYSISGRPYVAGQTSEFLPLYAGGIEDWIDGHLGIDNTYTIMMFRPTDTYNTKLITERVVHEAYAALDTLLLQSVEQEIRPVVQHTAKTKGNRISPTSTVLLLIGLVKILCS